MWDDHRDGRREHAGAARALAEGDAPDGRIWNGHAWQEDDAWGENGLVTFPVHAGAPKALRAECQCSWHGPGRPIDGDPSDASAVVKLDWEEHIAGATVATPPRDVVEMVDDLRTRLYMLGKESPLAVLDVLRDQKEWARSHAVMTVGRGRRRQAGAITWQEIADALGITRENALEEYQFAGNASDVEAAYKGAAPPVA
ncbi:hypothetical protein AB0O47_39575 [Streptomyces noursei]|uniref:hypothetical protein n=1 Tax=Streptomyces noursei TaxID=1971 RepID=UPI00344BBDA7